MPRAGGLRGPGWDRPLGGDWPAAGLDSAGADSGAGSGRSGAGAVTGPAAAGLFPSPSPAAISIGAAVRLRAVAARRQQVNRTPGRRLPLGLAWREPTG